MRGLLEFLRKGFEVAVDSYREGPQKDYATL